jgi:type VI secretion system protein ImpH
MASPSGGPTPPVKPAPLPAEAVRTAAPGTLPAATADGNGARPAPKERTLERWLYAEPFCFDFFQAVRIFERLQPTKKAVARGAAPRDEVARFKAHLSLSFPPSPIYDLALPSEKQPVPTLTVAFLGLHGPSGILPRHYTELLLRIDKEGKGPEKSALRDWFDVFNHRLISLFYRAWEKYRFYIPYERGEYLLSEPDSFTQAMYSFVGLGFGPLRNRVRVGRWLNDDEPRAETFARVDDLVLLYYSGFLAHRPRNAVSLEGLIADYFRLPATVQQFQGQWLPLDRDNQTQMGSLNCALGTNVVAGERVWDVQSKFRVRLGPLPFEEFTAFLPDRTPGPQRKAFFLLSHLVRLYAGPEFDFEVQLVLRAQEVPECHLSDGGIGPRLGWNTWVRSLDMADDAEEAVFAGEELVWLGAPPPVRDEFE